MNKKTVISIAQNLLLVLLLAAMLVQCVLYISLAQSYDDGVLPSFPESEARFLSSSSPDKNEVGRAFVFPYFIGALTGEGRFGGSYSDSLAYDVFNQFTFVLKNAPEGTSKKVLFTETDEKYEYLKELYNSADSCYYMKLKNGIEFSVLCQLVSDTYTQLPENPDFVICDMFLMSGAMGEASITAVDPLGNVLKIYPSKNIPFNIEYLESYNNTEKDEFEFVKIEANEKRNRNCYFPVFKYSTEHQKVRKLPFSDCFDISDQGNDIRDFVNIFGMNDDNTKFYRRGSDGAMICAENATTFEITRDGYFQFTPDDDGGDLDLFLEIDAEGDYGFYEYACVAQNIVEALSRKLTGYCAVLSLEDITYKSGECGFYYNYTVNGIPVEYGGEYALELRFSEEKLVYARGTVCAMESIGVIQPDIPQKTAYILMDKVSGAVGYFGAEYCFDEEADHPDVGAIRWSVQTESVHGGTQE